jgi:hypothetical protein
MMHLPPRPRPVPSAPGPGARRAPQDGSTREYQPGRKVAVDGQWLQNQASLQYPTGFVLAFSPRTSGRLRRGTTHSLSPLN